MTSLYQGHELRVCELVSGVVLLALSLSQWHLEKEFSKMMTLQNFQ